MDVPTEFLEAINKQTHRRASGHEAAGWIGSVVRVCSVCCFDIEVGAPCVGCLDCSGATHINCNTPKKNNIPFLVAFTTKDIALSTTLSGNCKTRKH